jgi:DNA-binding GntR family transcriptional regulator
MADDPHALAAPLQQSSLVEQIYRRLQRALMHGQMAPHQRLKVRDLAATLGTSETPVREALFQLVRDRAIEIKSRSFVRVRRPSRASTCRSARSASSSSRSPPPRRCRT